MLFCLERDAKKSQKRVGREDMKAESRDLASPFWSRHGLRETKQMAGSRKGQFPQSVFFSYIYIFLFYCVHEKATPRNEPLSASVLSTVSGLRRWGDMQPKGVTKTQSLLSWRASSERPGFLDGLLKLGIEENSSRAECPHVFSS